MSKFKIIRFIASVYIEVIRGTPILLQLFIFVFALPMMIPIKLDYFTWTAIALSINSAAYVSEVFSAPATPTRTSPTAMPTTLPGSRKT